MKKGPSGSSWKGLFLRVSTMLLITPISPNFKGLKCSVFGCFRALQSRNIYGKTPQKKAEAKIIRERLSKELDEFQDCVKSYNLADGEDKKDCELSIMMKLKWNAPFAAFKRWMIRDASDKFPELLKYCQ